MEQNLAAILQRFESHFESMAADLERIARCLELLVIDIGETDAEGAPLVHIRVHQIEPQQGEA